MKDVGMKKIGHFPQVGQVETKSLKNLSQRKKLFWGKWCNTHSIVTITPFLFMQVLSSGVQYIWNNLEPVFKYVPANEDIWSVGGTSAVPNGCIHWSVFAIHLYATEGQRKRRFEKFHGNLRDSQFSVYRSGKVLNVQLVFRRLHKTFKFCWRSTLSLCFKSILISSVLIFYFPLLSLAKLEEEFEKKFNSLPQYSPITFDRKSVPVPRKKKKVGCSSADQSISNKGKTSCVMYFRSIAATLLDQRLLTV